jgi:hypothetical protein
MSDEEKIKLSSLELKKTAVVYSPVEGNDVLVRTGVLRDRFSFLHAIHHAINEKYVDSDTVQREKIVKKFYTKMNEKNIMNDKNTNKKLNDSFKALFNDVHYVFRKKRDTKNRDTLKIIEAVEKNLETYDILFSLINFSTFEKILDSDSSLKIKKESCIEIVAEELKKIKRSVDKERRIYCLKCFSRLLNIMYDEVYEKVKKDCKKRKQKVEYEVNEKFIQDVSEYIDRDIYIIDCDTRLPKNYLAESRKSIILLNLDDDHYEVMGRLLPGNSIQRNFDFGDPLIRRIYSFLYDIDVIKKEYPYLLPYVVHSEVNEEISRNLSEESQSDLEYVSHSPGKSNDSKSDDSKSNDSIQNNE